MLSCHEYLSKTFLKSQMILKLKFPVLGLLIYCFSHVLELSLFPQVLPKETKMEGLCCDIWIVKTSVFCQQKHCIRRDI